MTSSRIALLVLLAALFAAALPAASCGRSGCSVALAAFVRFDDVTYYPSDRQVEQDELGAEFRRVDNNVSGTADCDYRARDGDSSHLAAGTPLYQVADHDPELLLAAVVDGRVVVYEAGYVEGAQRGDRLPAIADLEP